MSSRLLDALVLVLSLVVCPDIGWCQTGSPPPPQDASEESNVLYALGVSLMRDLSVFDLTDAELEHVLAGMKASLKGEFRVDPGLYESRIQVLARSRVSRVIEAQNSLAAPFIANELSNPKAIQTPTGLVFTSMEDGTGERPGEAANVQVHFRGFLVDGTEFDSSYRRERPLDISLGEVIPCWKEGIRMIKPEGKARLICPPGIAYGQAGRPPAIPPGATLVFEIQLLETQAAGKQHPKSIKALKKKRK